MGPPGIPLEDIRLLHFREHLPGSIESEVLFQTLQSIIRRCEAAHGPGTPACKASAWTLISTELLSPSLPWPIHELLYSAAFCAWDEADLGPPPAWTPSPGQATETNIGLLLRNHGPAILGDQWGPATNPAAVFSTLQRLSYDQPELYWPSIMAELGIVFHQKPDRIADFDGASQRDASTNEAMPSGAWFPGASLNIAESCLTPTANGKRADDRLAVVWREEGPDGTLCEELGTRTLGEVRRVARQVAAGLTSLGLGHGAAVAVYLPMTVDSVCAYLGILLAGSTVVSVAESFSASELASRLKIAGAKAIITQDAMWRGGKALPLYSRVVEANAPQAIVLQAQTRPPTLQPHLPLRAGDLTFSDLLSLGQDREEVFTPPAMPSEDFCNILFSSGTTGTPKAIPWSQVGPIKAAADAFMHQDVRPGDVVAWPTSLGWMMGPWLIFAALVNGATIALFQGNPSSLGFLRFVQDAGVTMLGVIPSLVRAWRALTTKYRDSLSWTSIRAFSSTGEASTPMDTLWLMSRAGYRAPVLEYCGGTEIGGAFVTGTLVQPQALSCFSTAAMGCRLVILNERTGAPEPEGKPCTGECALMPHMLGSSWTLLNADNFQVYFQGMPRFHGQVLRRHGDAFERLPHGYFKAHGRTDDTMNLGGIKVSSVEIERVCNRAHPAVVETAAVGLAPREGGPEELVVFAVLRGSADAAVLRACLTEELRKALNPLFKVAQVEVVRELPRTATNKVLRRQLRGDLMSRSKKTLPQTKARL